MDVLHDHFGNLRKYRKINRPTKRKSNRKSTKFVNFLAVSRYRQLYLLDIFLILSVHIKILQNNQQIKELQAAYENRKRFTVSLNGTYAKM